MGSGSSFMRSQDDEDILGSDLEGTNGVMKRIPIEIKPRGKLGLPSVGSLGRSKPKGGSLRSALSMDLENPEVERIRKDFEMYRLNKDNDIVNMQKKEKKLETENKRLRAELLALQKTCARMRAERDAALEAEQEALARASAFESDRDKMQRQFKLFRETKESEIQNLLRNKQEMENRLSKAAPGGVHSPEDSDSQSRSGVVDLGTHSHGGDWWTVLESEPSLCSMMQLHQPAYLRGPEFASSVLEVDGPFMNINKEDWNLAMLNANRMLPTGFTQAAKFVLRVYVSVSPDMLQEYAKFIKDHSFSLHEMCEAEKKSVQFIHLHPDASRELSQRLGDSMDWKMRKQQVGMAFVFVAFLGCTLHRFSYKEVREAHLDNPGHTTSIFVMSESADTKNKASQETRELKRKIRECVTSKVSVIHTSPQSGSAAQAIFRELSKLIKAEMTLEKENADFFTVSDSLGETKTDWLGDGEQLEALNSAIASNSQIGFEKYYDHLNTQVAAAGPLPPLLVVGSPGSGKTLLLAKWLHLLEEKHSTSVLLYHFVGCPHSVSRDPILMIRRLTVQLLSQMYTPPSITCDPVRLVEEFPRWLEKVSAKSPGGVILVLDSVDRFQQADVHLKWLLDPLPVDARVIVSVNDKTCPQAWRSWPTLQMQPWSKDEMREHLQNELGSDSISSNLDSQTDLSQHIMHQCHPNSNMSSPLYLSVVVRKLKSLLEDAPDNVSQFVLDLPNHVDCQRLYQNVLTDLLGSFDGYNQWIQMVLGLLYSSRCGVTESELLALVPGVGSTELCLLFHFLSTNLIVKYQSGLWMFAHGQARDAVYELMFDKEGETLTALRHKLIEYFQQFIRNGDVSCRAVDELPWLIQQTGDVQALEQCILDLNVFHNLCTRGRSTELLGFWHIVGWEKEKVASAYFDVAKGMHSVGQSLGDKKVLVMAEMYETLGLFFKDLGLLSQALPALQRALELRETNLDPDDPIVARSLHHLAGLHGQWGKFNTAEMLYQHALEICQNALGADHPLVAKELEALAILYQKQDKHELAHPLRKRAFAIKKRLKTSKGIGSDPSIDPLQKRALQLEELVMGLDSADLARTLNELGVLYYLQNNADIAESYFKRALEMRESVLGPDHLDVASSLNNLAALYNDRKLYEKSEPLYDRALKIRLKHQSPDSPGVASIINHLAKLYKLQGKLDKAEPLYKQTMEIREKVFGPNHPSLATAGVNLAVLLSQQNRFSEAEPLYEQALKIYEYSLGAHHPRVAETLRNLAVMKYEQEDYVTAAHYYKRATEIREQSTAFADRGVSGRCSSIDTNSNSTVKNS